LGKVVGLSKACESLNVPRSSLYRKEAALATLGSLKPRPKPARALSDAEKVQVLELANSERFCDKTPREMYAILLDEDQRYVCHWRTIYRILAEVEQIRARRDQKSHPKVAKPQLKATGPNQVWTWDITKLRGPDQWQGYYLYVIIDLYSRYIVGWMIAERESAELAEILISQTCQKQGISPHDLTLHADRGAVMRSQSVTDLLSRLELCQSHSRPYTPNDNAFSEAQFKTMKYRPDYPKRFACFADAQTWARAFFDWYNSDHRHAALGLLTPEVVHLGLAEIYRAQRQLVLDQAYQAHPERFVKGQPTPPELPEAVWINPPQTLDLVPEAEILSKTTHQSSSEIELDLADHSNQIQSTVPVIFSPA
jgi:putative transposase